MMFGDTSKRIFQIDANTNYSESMSDWIRTKNEFIENLNRLLNEAGNNDGGSEGFNIKDNVIGSLSDSLNALRDLTERSVSSTVRDSSNKEAEEKLQNLADETAGVLDGFGSWANPDYEDRKVVMQKDVQKEEPKEEEAKSPDYDIDEMAGEFILGAWGNGQDRIDNMLNAGYTIDDYNTIQQRVNDAYASGRDLHEWTNKANAKLHYW